MAGDIKRAELAAAIEEALLQQHQPAVSVAEIASKAAWDWFNQQWDAHYVVFTDDRWFVEHSFSCRVNGEMTHCESHKAIAAMDLNGFTGRWRISFDNHENMTLDLVR